MIGQKEAVVNTLLSVLRDRDVEYEMKGEISLKSVLTKEDKAKVHAILLAGFESQEISMTDKARANNNTEAKMKSYVGGLISNWVKKNPEFNNGKSYIPENKGSRTGQSDEQIKNLRLMKKTITDEETLAEIDEAIADRLAIIKPESVIVVKAEAIPEHLRHLVKGYEDKINNE